MITRRQWLLSIANIGGLACIPALGHTATTAPKPPVSLRGPLRKNIFLALLGQTFSVTGGNRGQYRAKMTLIDVYDDFQDVETEQFSVVFQAPRSIAFPPGIYTLRHSRAGQTLLMLQPGEHDASSRYYEAAFNLLI
ncbi:MAG: hypothetical protein U1F68_11360 [Gammaproteobacteria bacterium]